MPPAVEDINGLKAWLGELDLTPEQRTSLEGALGTEKNLPRVRDTFRAQSEFSRRMNEMQTERQRLEADLQAKQAAVDKDFARLTKWEGDANGVLTAKEQALQKATERLAVLETRMRRLGAEHGIPESELGLDAGSGGSGSGSGDGSGNGNGNGAGAVDERYFTKEQWTAAQRDIQLFPQVAAEMDDIVDDVRELTGTRIKRSDLLREVAEANSRSNGLRISMRDYVEDKYKLAEERQKVAEKKQKEHDDRIRTETETRVRSEIGVSTPRPSEVRRSPVLERAAVAGKTATQQPGYKQAPSGVSKAVEAYNKGTYQAGA